MKILSSQQIREADKVSMKQETISSLQLMERASTTFCKTLVKKFPKHKIVHIICGSGNNGADGLVIARILKAQFFQVRISVLEYTKSKSSEFESNYKRLSKDIFIKHISSTKELSFGTAEIIIDAILGSGLNRAIEGNLAEIIHKINSVENLKIAVDIPSGLFCDADSSKNPIIQASNTFTFQLPKLAFLFPQYAKNVGEWTILDIQLNQPFIDESKTKYFYLEKKNIQRILKNSHKFDHKGTKGHALIIAGSEEKMGAAILSSKACLKTGSGLVTSHVPKNALTILQIAIPEVMLSLDKNKRAIRSAHKIDFDTYQAIGIGPGLGLLKKTKKCLRKFLERIKQPLVLDADALNLISQYSELFDLIPPKSILTPHPKEFERIVGKWSHDFERLDKQKELAWKLQCVVVLKGAHTSIATPEGEVYFNSTGNAGMATAGSGDVLTGIITSLLGQGYNAKNATILGVFLHGLAGDIAKKEIGEQALIASDIIENIGNAYLSLEKQENNA